MTSNDLKRLENKPGYGIKSSIGGGVSAKIRGQRQVPELERSSRHESIRPPGFAIPYSGRCNVRVKVYRKRLTDPLGDCTKYHIDALRYLGCLVDDSDAKIRLTDEGHEKVETDSEERVEITIEYDGITLEGLCKAYANGPLKICTK